MRSNWRDCAAWNKQGFKFNTTNNEVCKLYDAAITQYIGMYNDEQLNGIEGTVQSMLNNDPDFIMGHVFKIGVNCVNQPNKIKDFKNDLKNLTIYKDKHVDLLARFEVGHINALIYLFKGNLLKACNEWENVLIEYPNDILALKYLYDAYFHLGLYELERKDSVASVLPFWNSSIPLYEYVYGLYAFALAEVNLFKEADEYARKSLFINPFDSWAVHSLAHVQDYQNNVDEGIKFLNETENYWCKSFLNCHNYWHLALHHIEKGEFDIALNVYDEHMIQIAKKTQLGFSIIDAAAFLYRLKFEKMNNCFKVDLNERWLDFGDLCYKNIDKYSYVFTNVHLFMGISALGNDEANAKFYKVSELFNQSLDGNETQTKNYFQSIDESIGLPLYQAITHFDNAEFSQVVDLLYPLRYQLHKMGGSNAQFDLFNQILTQSALRSHVDFHNKIGIKLLNERKAFKPNSNVNERLISSLQISHNHV